MGITRTWSRLDETIRKPVASLLSDNIKSPVWHTYYCMTAGYEAACECRLRWHVAPDMTYMIPLCGCTASRAGSAGKGGGRGGQFAAAALVLRLHGGTGSVVHQPYVVHRSYPPYVHEGEKRGRLTGRTACYPRGSRALRSGYREKSANSRPNFRE